MYVHMQDAAAADPPACGTADDEAVEEQLSRIHIASFDIVWFSCIYIYTHMLGYDVCYDIM